MFLQVAALIATSFPAQANPLAPTVAAGHAAFDASGATLTITTSDRAVIDWQSFGINAGEMTHFIQPNAHSAVLNRVTGGDPSALLGTLQANGQVYLINPNGIIVGNGAYINAGSFMATTLDIDNALFMRGGDLDFKGNSNASVINHGTIRAIEGNVYLVANRVENHGIISASGHVGLAAGNDVRVVDGAHPQLVVRPTSASTSNANGGVLNTGLIEATRAELIAAHGNVYALAINNTGTIRTNGVEVNEDGIFLKANGGRIVNTGNLTAKNADGSGGNVVIDSSSKTAVDGTNAVLANTANANAAATGSVALSGTVDVSADAAGKTGGSVQITSDNIELAAANINADGPGGGGSVRIGGDYQGGAGSPAPLPNAVNLTIDAASKINASATQNGNAGRVIAWSNGTTRFAGNIEAKGALGGAGGFAEVSGKQVLEFVGGVNLGGGSLLLDPTDFTIDATTAAAIVSTLATSDVKVTTNGATAGNGDVFINSAIIYNSSRNFQILAHRNIYANADVQNSGLGSIGLIAGWDGVTDLEPVSGITTVSVGLFNDAYALRPYAYGNNGGSVYLDRTGSSTRVGIGSAGNQLAVAGYDVVVKGSDTSELGYAQLGYRPTVAGGQSGSITVRARNDILVTARLGAAHIGVGEDNTTPVAGPNRIASIDVAAGRDIIIQGGTGINVSYAMIGQGGYNVDAALSGSIAASAGRNISILAGSNGSIAMLGHGGYNSTGAHQGDILVTAAELTIRGGFGFTTYAQLGHGGEASTAGTDVLSGSIRVNVDKLNIESGFFSGAYAQIGHGGNSYGSTNGPSGTIEVTVTGELSFSNGGAGAARIGHWSNTAVNFTSSPVRISVGALDGVFNNASPALTADLTNIFGSLVNDLKGGNVTFIATGLNGNDGSLIFPAFNAAPTLSNTLEFISTGSATFANAATFNGSSKFSISAADNINFSNVFTHSTGSGTLLLRGDADGNGVGNVNFSGAGKAAFTGSSGAVTIRYNPTTYTSPTDFISAGRVELGSSGATLSAQMLVNDLNQLQLMSTNVAGNYALGRDLDASSTSGWNGGNGFNPISGYSGTFDGDGHVIAGLVIARSSTSQVGLFGSSSGIIRNIGLINASITGGNRTGGLVGENTGTITQSFVEGSVRGAQFTGGIVGWNAGTISNTYSGATIVGSLDVAGGLVGNHNSGTISNSYANGPVSGTTDIGGLVGTNKGTLSSVYASGLVTGTLRTGGLVGTNTGTVTNGYYDSTTTNAAGSGVALNSTTAYTQSSYTGFNFTSTWTMRSGSTRPMLQSEFSTTIQNAHQLELISLFPTLHYVLARDISLSDTRNLSGSAVWNPSTGFAPIGGNFTGELDGAGHTIDGLYINNAGGASGLISLARSATIHDLIMTNVDVTSTISTAALVGQATQYTTIRNVQVSGTVRGSAQIGGLVGLMQSYGLIDNVQTSVTVVASANNAGGLVGSADSLTIRGSAALGSVTSNTGAGGLVGALTSGAITNSFATGAIVTTSNGGGLVGQTSRSIYDNVYATGSVTFDVTATSVSPSSFGGLLGSAADSRITNSYATGNVTAIPSGSNTGSGTGGLIGNFFRGYVGRSYATGVVQGYTAVGGLIGVSSDNGVSDIQNIIENSYSTGNVSGRNQIGGLVGSLQEGTVMTSYATGSATASTSDVGGLAGSVLGVILNSYATGSVSGPNAVGGLVGTASGAIIDKSFSTGLVTGSTLVGGLIGSSSATVTNNFWDTQTSGRSTSAGGAGAVGRTTAQMKTLSTFTSAGWNFADTWEIFQGITYPHFQYQTIPGVTVVGTVYTDTGVTKAGAGVNVTLLQNGTVVGTAITNSSSVYKFIAPLANGDKLIAYLNDNAGKLGTTGWRTDGASNNALDIYGNTLTATSTATKFADNAMFAQGAGSVVDTDILYTSTISGSDTNLSVTQGINFLLPTGQNYRLDGNLSTAGGNINLLGGVVIAATAPTIRTDAIGGALAAGSVNFATTGSLNALVAGVQSLTVNTTADGGGTAGSVRLGDVGAVTRLKGITVSSGAGLLTLTDTDADGFAKIQITTGNVDFSNVTNVQLNANTQITSQPTAAGQGSVLFQLVNGQIIGDVAGRNLKIDVRGASTGVDDDGDVTLPPYLGTNAIIGGSLEVLTDKGTITLGNGTFATYKMRDTGAGFGIRFVGDAVLTGDMTLESNNSVADFGSSTFSSNALGRWRLSVQTDGGFDPAANIRFAGADNAGGNYLGGIQLYSDSFFFPTDGKVTFVDDRDNLVSIQTDTNFFAFTGLAVAANNLVLEDSTYIASMGASPGRINLGTALIDAKFDNLSLTMTTVGATFGGQIEFGTIGRDTVTGGGHYLGNVSAAVNGTSFTGSRITLDSDITIDHTLGTGGVTLAGRVEVTGARAITSQVGNDSVAGTIDLGGAQLYGTAAGNSLTLNASAVGVAGGDVVLGSVGNDGNSAFYLRNLDIDARGSTGGAIVLAGSTITLDGVGAVGNISRLTALGGGIVLATGVTIQTESGGDQSSASIDFSSTPISASAAGFDLKISTVTSATGGTSGDITLGNLSNGTVHGRGGFYVNDLTLDTSGTSAGRITTGNIRLDALGSDTADVAFTGRFVLSGSTLIDTEAGNDASGGQVNLRLAPVSASTTGFDLTIDTSTTAIAAAGGNIQLRDFNSAGGQLVRSVSLDARPGTGGTAGTLTLDGGMTLASNFSFVGGAASLSTASAFVLSGGSISILSTSGAASGIAMTDGSALRTTSGNITLRANAAISLSRINADDDSDNNRGDVIVAADFDNSGAGSILDNLAGEVTPNILARNVSLTAADKIGNITDFTTGAGDGIDLNLSGSLQSAVVTQAGGNIFLVFQGSVTADAGAIVVNPTGVASLILQASGNVDLGSAGNALVLSSGDDVAISAGQVLTLPNAGVNVGTGQLRLIGTNDIRDSDRSLGTLVASNLTFNSGNSGGNITVATTVATLTAQVSANNLTINEADGLTALSINAGAGDVTLTAGGAISDSDAAVDIIAATATVQLNGNFGSSTNAIGTTVAALSINSTNGSQWITETDGLSAFDLKAGTGDVFLTAGGAVSDSDALVDIIAASANIQLLSGGFGLTGSTVTTTVSGLTISTINADQRLNNFLDITALNLTAGTGTVVFLNTGSIQDADAALDVVAARATIVGTGDLGSSAHPLGINLTFFTAGSSYGSAWFAEADGLSSINLNAPQGTFTLTSGGSILDTDAVTDVDALAASFTLTSGDFGSSANPIGVTVADLAVSTAAGNQWTYGFSGLTALNLNAGSGTIALTVAGSVLDDDAAADIIAGSATVALTTGGNFGSATHAIGTAVADLSIDSGNGSQWINETDGLTALSLIAGTGDVTLTAGGAILDSDTLADIIAASATVRLMSGDFGSGTSAIGTTVSSLSIDSTNGNQFINQTGGLNALSLTAGTGAITLTTAGSILDTDNLTDVVAASATITLTSGDFGSSSNAIGTTVAALSIDSGNGSQFIAETDGLTALSLIAGTGDVTLTAGGSILDSDTLADIIAANATISLNGNFGTGTDAIGTTVATLSVNSTNGSQWINQSNGLTALSLIAGTGDVTLTAGGPISDSDALADFVAATATIQLNGNFGTSTNAIGTTVAALNVNSANGSQWIAETDGLTALNLTAGTGDVTLTAGASILDSDALADIVAASAVVTLTAGNFGSSTGAIGTTVASLTVNSTNGDQFINETDGLTALSLTAGTGAIALTAGGAIADFDAAVDISAATATIQLSGDFGTSTNAIATTVAGFSVNSTNGSQFINETDGLTALSLIAGTGDVTLTAGGSILDSDALVDIVANSATVTLTVGNFGSSNNAIGTTVAGLSVDSTNGSQWINQTAGLTALSLIAGTGDVTLTAGGAILDSDAAVDITAASAVIHLTTGDFGSGASAIGTTLADLSVATDDGSQWISETDGLTALAFSALGAGHDITLRSVTGDLRLVSLHAADRITLDAASGGIQDAGSETGPQLLATTIDLTAAIGIGIAGPGLTTTGDLDFDATHISAVNTTSGGIFLEKLGTGPVTFDLVDLQNAGDVVNLASSALTTLTDVRSTDGSITVNVTGTNDLQVIDVNNLGAGSIDLAAGRDIAVRHEVVAAAGGGIHLQSGRDVTLITGALSQNVAVRSLSGDIQVDAGRDVGLSATAGHTAELGSQSNPLRVAAGRDVTLTASASGIARIGGRTGSSGGLEVAAGRNAVLDGSSGGVALIGHAEGAGDVLVTAGVDLILRSAAGSTAQIGHLTKTGAGNVDVAWNQAAQPFSGSGRLVMTRTGDGTTSITAGGSPSRVRLFGGSRDGFVLLNAGIMINSHPFSGVHRFQPQAPIAGLAGSSWDQNVQFFNWSMEQWGTATLSSLTKETSPFTFYFNTQTPGLDASAQFNFFGLLNGLGFEYERSRYLLDGVSGTINVQTMAETGEPSFDARRRAEIGAEITGASSL